MKTSRSFILILEVLCIISAITILSGCGGRSRDLAKEKEQIAILLDAFNEAAARADFTTYFGYYADDAVFAGTDAGEYWNKTSFMAYAKPYFDKGKAWSFVSVERHICIDKSGSFAWFDELLSTQMKICRGSGVLCRKGDQWKIKQYVLSMTIPNELADTVMKIKSPLEDVVMDKLSKKQK